MTDENDTYSVTPIGSNQQLFSDAARIFGDRFVMTGIVGGWEGGERHLLEATVDNNIDCVINAISIIMAAAVAVTPPGFYIGFGAVRADPDSLYNSIRFSVHCVVAKEITRSAWISSGLARMSGKSTYETYARLLKADATIFARSVVRLDNKSGA
jgi:hypothetical protein